MRHSGGIQIYFVDGYGEKGLAALQNALARDAPETPSSTSCGIRHLLLSVAPKEFLQFFSLVGGSGSKKPDFHIHYPEFFKAVKHAAVTKYGITQSGFDSKLGVILSKFAGSPACKTFAEEHRTPTIRKHSFSNSHDVESGLPVIRKVPFGNVYCTRYYNSSGSVMLPKQGLHQRG